MRKVLQNGMSFANEWLRPAVSLRVRYYFYFLAFGVVFATFIKVGAKILSVSLNLFWEIFLMENLLNGFLSNVQFDKAFDFAYIFKSIVSKWYLYLALALVIIGVVLFACLVKQPKRNDLTKTQKMAYMAIMSALSVALNVVQIPTPLVQLSFVATICFMAGVLLGPVEGFAVGFIGDLIAGIVAPMGVYSPIIGIGTSLFGLVPGVIFAFFNGKDWVKAIISFAITFVLTSILINTIGLSLIYPKYYVLTERVLLLPLNLLFHAINCALSILLIKTFKRVLPKGKFQIDK